MIKIKRGMAGMFVLATAVIIVGLFGQDKSAGTYLLEGQMLDRGVAVNGQCRFQVELWDQQTGNGVRTGPVQEYDVALEQGRFHIRLNERGEFGPVAFRNQGYWLDLGVKCSGDREFVKFEGRQWVGEATQAYELSWWTVDGGGGTSTSTGGNLELTGTIGQPDAGTATGSGSLTLVGGFWGAAGSGYRIHLPTVIK
jgi:hypothetical protein